MGDIICPKCGVKSTDKDFDNGEEQVGIRTNDKGKLVCECWECNHKWTQD